jgi:hypothetical protein
MAFNGIQGTAEAKVVCERCFVSFCVYQLAFATSVDWRKGADGPRYVGLADLM